eukprot:m.110091 g.110091  ORF g.110091 m.110091 type:complete len:75 (-) comp51791_c0_seq2:666-890(-)
MWVCLSSSSLCSTILIIFQVKGFSSGFLPLVIPLAPLLNVAFFFVPFSDNNFNEMRMNLIRERLLPKFSVQVLQ